MKLIRILSIVCLAVFLVPGLAMAQLQNLGMVGIKSTHGRYLQAHTDGELHASNEHRNEEETWFLVEVDKANHVYALQNWRTGHFMSRNAKGCAPAVSTTLGPNEKWVLVNGHAFGIENAVGIKSLNGGFYLGG